MNKTHFYPQVFGRAAIILSILALSLFVFINQASAEDFYFFRIDTELDVLNAKGVTITWKCNGSGQGIITDNTASESTQALDGIIKVASTSVENNSSHAGCDASESITATASLDGWVNRTWTDTVSAAGSNVTFTTRASMDYNFVAYPIKDELGTILTLNGTAASASYSGTTASISYSNAIGSTWKRYIAATGDGTLTGGGDGYVNKTIAVTWSLAYGTTSKSADFDGTAANSTYNGDVLPFGIKVTVAGTTRFGETISGVTGRTVTAGNSSAISCTDGGSGNYYCPVPIAHTEVIATSDAFRGLNLTLTCTYTDRTVPADTQKSCAINATESSGSGGGGTVTEPTPTPTPTPEPGVSPTPEVTPTPTPAVTTGAVKLYRKVADPKVYVQRADGLLTWVRTLEEFTAAGYNWADVQVISGPEFAQLKISPASATNATLFRKANDSKVYVQGSDGILTWVKTLADFSAAGYNWADVKVISGEEFGKMRVGGNVRIVKGIAFLRVRSGPSTADKVVGQVLPDQELKFTEIKNGWYHINSGWVSGAYAKEF